jgi:glucose-1-phosphate cytidylyltransferase
MKTVILAGGLGTRLSEETTIKPKPMVEIGGMPILWHIMKYYSQFGFIDFSIALGYKGDIIKNFFYNYKMLNSDLKLDFSSDKCDFVNNFTEKWKVGLYDTGKNSMTGGRLFNLKKIFTKGETFMLTYGDGLCNINIKQLLDFHKSHSKIATISAVRPSARFGTLDISENNHVIDFKEKPQTGEGWINGGYFVFNYEIFDYLLDDSTILELDPLEKLAKSNQLVAFKHEDFWQCMDTIRDRDHLNELWTKNLAPWKIW